MAVVRVFIPVDVAAPGVVQVREVELLRAPSRISASSAGRSCAFMDVMVKRRPTFTPLRAQEGTAARLRSNAPSRRRNLSCVGLRPSRLMPT